MLIRSSSALLGLSLAVGVCSQAFAVTPEVPDGQEPPAEKSEKPSDTKKEEPKCVTNQTGFKQVGDKPVFEVALENSCDVRLKCTIDIYVLGAKGPVQGHTTMVLGPAAKGQTTRKVYALKVKSAGGMANMSQECKKL
ncbi:hypothetical protein [Rhodoplanes sp. Z2-YC6860]|uniref:hypothetical protein n=1 Tax=Rhodoplanes sp. Z2-YC6860 TaxID=674703 RepID=UPI0012EDCA8C|nr:hypothetical protein [Rhodoplanes sp. Z2-YC6860]